MTDVTGRAGAAGAAGAVADAADAAADRSATFRRLLAAGRERLRDAAGRVVTVVDELVPARPAVVLKDLPPSSAVTLAADVAAELGIEPVIAVAVTVDMDRVTLRATTAETSAPERLAAILVSEASELVFVAHFTRLDATLATARVDIGDATPPLSLALVVGDPGPDPR